MVNPIGGLGAAAAAAPTRVTPATVPTVGTGTTEATAPGGFGDLVSGGLQAVSQMEHTADAAIEDLATGGPTTVEDVMIATSQASLSIDMLARVRDRALEAYQEIMRMPL